MNLTFKPFTLDLKHEFSLATGSRKTTPVVLTKIEYEGHIGYGEASMPPYLGETHKSVLEFLSKVDLSQFKDPFNLENILYYIDNISAGNTAAKASIDIALHDLIGKLLKAPWYKIWGYDKNTCPMTSFTIGMDSPEIIYEKIKEANSYKLLKVKLGSIDDKKIIEAIRKICGKPIIADINQGWKDKHYALDMIYWLNERNVKLIEQPMPAHQVDDLSWLTENSPLPIFADEAVQRIADVIKCKEIYSGINIKLMKSTGMREANKMILLAKSFGLQVMIGCMTETSCAISAASQLSPIADWADLDGNLLIKNDPFRGTEIIDGKVSLTDNPGIGLDI